MKSSPEKQMCPIHLPTKSNKFSQYSVQDDLIESVLNDRTKVKALFPLL